MMFSKVDFPVPFFAIRATFLMLVYDKGDILEKDFLSIRTG